MSQLLAEASPKHCAERGLKGKRLGRRLLCVLSSSFSTVLSLFLLIWFILRPTKPQFYVKDAGVYQLSLPPRLLNSTVEFTLVSRNPNERVGVYYDSLRAYATYKGQRSPPTPRSRPSTRATRTPTFSPPPSPAPACPSPPLRLRARPLEGRVRWKVGTWVSGEYRIMVDCIAIVGFVPSDMSSP
ncbi:unnamed protein product [Spirodela intermedia]|uniref:Uncharacterized protein n=1 Tax=Spirodela intermedia TaxID=51605 RepID=A0A7I8JBA6_SPIIN|nr:unnamed protein product [Spirodela intermedia]CAA6666762.1 unnamed protein product [Spirodela intermedia]